MDTCSICHTRYDVSQALDGRYWRPLCACEQAGTCTRCRYPATHIAAGALACDKHGVPVDDRETETPGERTLTHFASTGEHVLPGATPCVLGGLATTAYAELGPVTSTNPPGRRAQLSAARAGQVVWLQPHLTGPDDARWCLYEVLR